jgi:hypothetical protein
MKIKWQLAPIMMLFYIISTNTIAANQNAIVTFNKYGAASCQDYTGTWVGFIGEAKSAKSWPVTLSLYNQNKKIIGNIASTVELEKSRKTIWADCKNGNLSNIFWGEKGDCGGYSQEGFLMDKNVLVLKLHYETLKEDTYFIAFLNKKSADYSHPIPKDLTLGIMKTCHAEWQH